ncbi:acyltransferase family protein [Chitinolyticbacter albus]|uniref:acyltransferase family protein n=1 Tax=Chitinolyticbacter albus TaxID=2961951 RepID=UPI00210C863C|nr:acyltransferase [Chitinolyticbacter albus]
MPQTTAARDGVQGLRAIAFILVLIQHAIYFACTAKGLDFAPYLLIRFGKIGVSMFFVISGYVMGECLNQGPRFMLNRALRIYPPYWLAVGLSWFLLSGTTPWSFSWNSFLLAPPASLAELNNSYSIPYWTLCYEIAFYLAVYMMILLRLKRETVAMVCVAWLTAIAIVDIYAPGINIHVPGWWILLSPESIYFVLGLFISTAGISSLQRFSGPQLLMIGVLLWVFGQSYKSALQAPTITITAVAFALVLLGTMRLRFPCALVRLGDMSYGAYLAHSMLIVAAMRAMPETLAGMQLAAVCAVLLAVGGIGGLAYGWVEFQIHTRLLKRIFRRTRAQPGMVELDPSPVAELVR